MRAVLVAGLVASFGFAATPALSEALGPPTTLNSGDDAVLKALESADAGDLSAVFHLLPLTSPRSAERALLEAQVNVALLREADARSALQRYFESADTSAQRNQRAHRIAATSAFFAGRYADAARHAASYLAGPAVASVQEKEGIERLARIATLLASEPRQTLDSRGAGEPVPTVPDKVGLIRTRVATPAASEEAVLDTGANLSVVSASAADRLGLRRIVGGAAVGNSLGGGVDVQLGIADRFEVAGAELRNVVFLIMDDEALTFPVPGGYRIDVIVGLPVLTALRRLTFGPGETLRLLPVEGQGSGGANLRVVGSDLFVLADIAGEEHPFFLDSGANASSLSTRFASEHPDLAGTPAEERRRAGAGNDGEKVRNNVIEQVLIRIADVEVTAPSLRVQTQAIPGEEERYGVLGADMIRMFNSVTLDFDHMRFEAVP